jgi:hypothetical protein
MLLKRFFAERGFWDRKKSSENSRMSLAGDSMAGGLRDG